VVDVKTGDIIWQFTSGNSVDMHHAIASPPTAVDTNSDGYVDRVYVGDLGAQMWVFNVSFDAAQKKSNSQWNGRILFKSLKENQKRHKIYYPPAVSFDNRRIPWVFFGTGDREDPTGSAWKEDRFYGVKDDGGGPYEEGNLEERSSANLNTFTPIHPTKKGWFFIFPKKSGEKALAKPAVFNKLLYFTTYTYTSTDVCKAAGEATLYTVDYLSGGGALVLDDYLQGKPSARSQHVGSGSEGVPSAPVISVDLKGKATLTIGTTSGKILSKGVLSPVTNKEILYWREVIP
jgi:type IV pilus assembly protein PilY1